MPVYIVLRLLTYRTDNENSVDTLTMTRAGARKWDICAVTPVRLAGTEG